MSEVRTVRGFEDAWKAPEALNRQAPRALLGASGSGIGGDAKARLARLASRSPEVMVKVEGRARDAGHLRAHLRYISRNGEVEVEDRDGALILGLPAIRELADDWSAIALSDSRRRADMPLSRSVVLSMPAETDGASVCDAARAFAHEVFGGSFDYVFALHTDTPHPHVHLTVRALGDNGERLKNPSKVDLKTWRQAFAQALRDRGVEAEATPRWARGVTRKSEHSLLRRFRERHEAGLGEPARVLRAAYLSAAKAAFQGEAAARTPWETQVLERQTNVRRLYLAQALLLSRSADPADQALGAKLEAFVRSMPQPDSQRLALARELRAANKALTRESDTNSKERIR